MTEQEIIQDIKENKIGKYSEKNLQELVKKVQSICDKILVDEPLSPEIASGLGNLAFDGTWRMVHNLQDSIDIALDSKKNWENPNNEDLYTVLSSMRLALHNSLAWLTSYSKYKESYRWLNEKEAFYQLELKERNERAIDPFKKAQWELERKHKEETGIPLFEPQNCTWVYIGYSVGKDDHYYDIDANGNVKKNPLTLTEVLNRKSTQNK